MTWNPNIPDLSNNISADYPDIKENLNELMLGMMNRPLFTYNGGSSAATIKISGGYYCCQDKFCFWASELTSTQAASGTPTANTWYYLYLDYSAITSGTAITNSELIWSTTAPSWNHTYRGYYNGSDRCIFACMANGAGNNFDEFFHDGKDYIHLADALSEYIGTPGNTWTDVDCSGDSPPICRKVRCTAYCNYGTGTSTCIARVNGQTGTGGYDIGVVTSDGQESFAVFDAFVDSSQIFQVLDSDNNGDRITFKNNGWYLPEGM